MSNPTQPKLKLRSKSLPKTKANQSQPKLKSNDGINEVDFDPSANVRIFIPAQLLAAGYIRDAIRAAEREPQIDSYCLRIGRAYHDSEISHGQYTWLLRLASQERNRIKAHPFNGYRRTDGHHDHAARYEIFCSVCTPHNPQNLTQLGYITYAERNAEVEYDPD